MSQKIIGISIKSVTRWTIEHFATQGQLKLGSVWFGYELCKSCCEFWAMKNPLWAMRYEKVVSCLQLWNLPHLPMSLETTMKCLSVFANLKKLKAKSKKKTGSKVLRNCTTQKQMFLEKTTLVSTYFGWLSIFFGSRGTFQKLNQIVQT